MEVLDTDASDAPEQGPAQVISVQAQHIQGATVDEIARNRICSVIPFPAAGVTCGVCSRQGKGTYLALTDADWERHLKDNHSLAKFCYSCAKCGKEFERKHGARCHFTVCRPPAPARSQSVGELSFSCSHCPNSQKFRTQRGLSQHQRFAHPIISNAQRAASAVSQSQEGPRATRLWSADETSTMLRWEAIFLRQGVKRDINNYLAEKLPGKSAKQVKERRSLTSYKALKAQLGPEVITLEGDSVDEAPASESVAQPAGPLDGDGHAAPGSSEAGNEACQSGRMSPNVELGSSESDVSVRERGSPSVMDVPPSPKGDGDVLISGKKDDPETSAKDSTVEGDFENGALAADSVTCPAGSVLMSTHTAPDAGETGSGVCRSDLTSPSVELDPPGTDVHVRGGGITSSDVPSPSTGDGDVIVAGKKDELETLAAENFTVEGDSGEGATAPEPVTCPAGPWGRSCRTRWE
jgi:hypothetical protein